MSSIPDKEVLYRYVNPAVFPKDQELLPISIFNDKELSCDWKKIQTQPELSIHVTQGKNLIVSINICDDIRNPKNPKRVGEVVDPWKQTIIHDPLEDIEADPFTPNLSHALIKGKKKAAVTTAIRDNSTHIIV
ncbi:MAG: hypothetical protein OCD02_11105 [Spirochaetaceae bacterium]